MTNETYVENVPHIAEQLASIGESLQVDWKNVPPEYEDLLTHLGNRAWRPHESGWPKCYDKLSAMAVDCIHAQRRQLADAEARVIEVESRCGDVMMKLANAEEREREACAAECERMMPFPDGGQATIAYNSLEAAAKAIRARGWK